MDPLWQVSGVYHLNGDLLSHQSIFGKNAKRLGFLYFFGFNRD